MRVVIDEATGQCPYCWEVINITVDLSAGSQVYTEDCAVCCHPILVHLRLKGDGSYTIDLQREND